MLLFNETDGEDMASIKEIANACNVSPTAVSRILSHDPSLSVSTAVRTRVEDEARRVGYRTPRQKRSERTFTISLALSPFDKPGFEERLVGKYREIAGSGYEIQLYNPNRKSDGIIAIGEFSRDEVKDLESTCGNLLMINNLGTSYSHDSIMMDYAQSEEMVVKMFLDKGISRAGYIGGTYDRANLKIGLNRARQFESLLRKYAMYDPSCFAVSAMRQEAGYKSIMSIKDLPPAFIFGDPDSAKGAVKALKERQSDALSVTYVNFFAEDAESTYALLIFPSDILKTALKLLVEKITGERKQSYSIYAPSALIEITP